MLQNLPVSTTVPASDLNRARQFYEGVLGFTPSRETPDGVEYASGNGTAFFVYKTGYAGTAQHTLMSWQVVDLDSLVSDLQARGVVFEEYDFPGLKTVNSIAQLGDDRVAWFKDSEGNILAVGTV